MDHEEFIRQTALRIEKDSNYGLVKYWLSWGDAKTDLIGSYYPDITCLRREGRQKIMIEVLTSTCLEDEDEFRRLAGLSEYCTANKWEFYLLCEDDAVRQICRDRAPRYGIKAKEVWLPADLPCASS